MSYEGSIRKEREQAAQMRTSEVILERLDKIMLSGADRAARRWCWELIQNACDVAPPDRKLTVEVELREKGGNHFLIFRHNGGVFSSKDLVRLTQQSSNKRGDKVEGTAAENRPESIGRFGTGFLTTHLLSRKVEIESILHDTGESPRKFTLPLDRSGETPEEIHEGVEQTFEALSGVDDNKPVNYDPKKLNTVFRYRLDESGVEVARKGIEDLHRHLPLVLAFRDRIGQVNIVHEGASYHIADRETVETREGVEIERVVVVSENGDSSGTRSFLLSQSNRTDIAIPSRESDGEVYIRQLEDHISRLFCAYPLLGTSDFPLPVVVNSPEFHPTEPRDGIYLTESDREKPKTNRAIFREAVQSLQALIKVCCNREWNNLIHFARLGEPDQLEWLSKSWYEENVLQPTRQTLLREPTVELASGDRTSIRDEEGNEQVYFPIESSEEAREEYWELSANYMSDELPKRSHIHDWYDLIWDRSERLRAGALTLASGVSKHAGLESFRDSRNLSHEEALEWLSNFYSYLNRHGSTEYFSNYSGSEDGYPILPNQYGHFKNESQLSFEDEIPSDLKDIAEDLGRDIRSELLHSALSPDVSLGTIDAKDLARDISSRVRERFKETDRSAQTQKAFRDLLYWFDEHPQLGEELFEDIYNSKHRLRTDKEAREDRRKARQYQEHQQALEERGFSSIQEALDHIDQMQQSENGHDPNSKSDYSQDEVREELADLLVERDIRTASDLVALRQENPRIFEHYPEPSLDKLEAFLQMLERVKGEVREHLASINEYDVSTWTAHERYPTVFSVEKRGHDKHVVLRPADKGKIIFYSAMELDVLELPDAELWVQAENQSPLRMTPGRLLRAVGVEAGSGFKFPTMSS